MCWFSEAEVWPCLQWTLMLSLVTYFTLAPQPFHFIPCLCRLTSIPTDFASAQMMQKLHTEEISERKACLTAGPCHLPIHHNLRERLPWALFYANDLFGNQKFVLLCSSDTKITLSPSKMPRNTVALLSGVILPLLINSKRSVNEDAWTFYLKTYFF